MSAIDRESVEFLSCDSNTPADERCNAPEEVAHHFNTAYQQYDAAKLGMWLFLATEILLFGGLFVLYAVFRSRNPGAFHYGSQFLDIRLGAINTVLLILSSLTMAIAVSAAQRGSWRLLVTSLACTFIGGAGFLGIKYVEYSHKLHEGLVADVGFYKTPAWARPEPAAPAAVIVAAPGGSSGASPAAVPAAAEVLVGDATRGRAVWDATCRTCHGANGEGMPGSGKPLAGSTFVAGLDDAALLAFVKRGRAPNDPLNTTGSQMPPKGGNPLLKDAALMDAIALVRTFAGSPAAPAAATTTAPTSTAAAASGVAPTAPTAAAPAQPFWIPKSSIPEPPAGPSEVAVVVEPVGEQTFMHHSIDPDRPVNAHQFFAIYYLMTGLHGIHVIVGMLVVGAIGILAMLGKFGPRCFTAVELGGLYWHIIDIIWIFLFPLFYLL